MTALRRRNGMLWVVLGLIVGTAVKLATFQAIFMWVFGFALPAAQAGMVLGPLPPFVGAAAAYIALRCWLLPFEPRTLRSALLMPVILLLGAALLARLYVPLGEWLGTLVLPIGERVALQTGGTTGVVGTVTTMLSVVGSVVLGAGLLLVEWLSTWLLRLAMPAGLAWAHPAGIGLLAAAGGIVTALVPALLALTPPGMSGAIFVGLVSFGVGLLAAIPHLLLTWAAWTGAAPA